MASYDPTSTSAADFVTTMTPILASTSNVTDVWDDNSTANVTDTTLPPIPEDMWLVRLVCEVYLSFPVAMLGIVGNFVAFIVLCSQSKQGMQTTTILLQALAVADTCVLVSTILLGPMRYVGWKTYSVVYYPYIKVYFLPFVYFFRLADTWFTVMMTIDRYIAVCHPLHAQRLCTVRRTLVSLIVIVTTTFLFSLPRFFEYELKEYDAPDGSIQMGYYHTPLQANQIYAYVYKMALYLPTMYLVPMTVLITLNVLLLRELERARRARYMLCSNGAKVHSPASDCHGNNPSKLDKRDVRSITVVVVVVVMICVVCNTFSCLAHMFWALQMGIKQLEYLANPRRYVANVSNVLVTINCAINFIVYCMFSRKFRSGLRHTCGCAWVRRLSRSFRSSNRSDSSGCPQTATTTATNFNIRPLLQVSVKKSHRVVNNSQQATTNNL